VLVEDRLFATLDSTTRQMVSPERARVLVTDTVGFIRKLPHHLVASFRSTLMETIHADLLLHVVDASDPEFRLQMTAVEQVVEDISAGPRSVTLVFNKADRIDEDSAAGLRVEFPGSFVLSAGNGAGVDALRSFLWEQTGGARRRQAP
jgi:GTP-binding protein HflX